ncbi:uncharacterized protein [Typha angustifolia]|uniref:uncharacterized protein isoform X1 n=1 Tax=Typha angustifolia TaxID=59011 RepID=UPI003C2AE0F3
MVLLRRDYDAYGPCFADTHYLSFTTRSSSLRPTPMAQHSPYPPNQESNEGDEEGEEHHQQIKINSTSSSSSSNYSKAWLQLGLGPSHQTTPAHGERREGITELKLFTDRPPPLQTPLDYSSMMPMMGYRRDMPWAIWNPNLFIGSSSAAAVPRQFADVRVVIPPPRPQTGVWFVLQAAQIQGRKPFLPQIPKNYLRIKDGRLTVRLLIKYLVNKLGLEDESQVELTCKGQLLLPFLTLQHVRDSIWSSTEAVASLPDSSAAADHVMTLHYGRSAS